MMLTTMRVLMMGGGGTNPCAEYSVATENPRSNSVRVALRSAGLCILGWRDAAGLPAHSDHSLIGVGLAGLGWRDSQPARTPTHLNWLGLLMFRIFQNHHRRLRTGTRACPARRSA